MPNVSNILPEDEILAQLAEECTELAQAALKLRRAINEVNWTPKSIEDCVASVIEEHADVCACFKALGWDDKAARHVIMNEKEQRWTQRLLEHPHPFHKNYEETDEHM